MRILFIIFVLINKFSNIMAQGYEIKSVSELIDLRKKENGKLLYQNQDDFSTVYQIDNQRILWFPGIGMKGILFENENVMKEVLKNGVPIEEDHFNPFKANQKHLLDLNENANYWLKVLSEKLGMEIDIDNDDIKYYDEISNKVNLFEPDKKYEELFIPLGIFIGEKMKRGTDAQWHFEKEYGYKPYYEPKLIESNGKVLYSWYKLVDNLLEKKKFDFNEYWKFAHQFGRR